MSSLQKNQPFGERPPMKLPGVELILLIVSLILAATFMAQNLIFSLWGDWLPNTWLVNSLTFLVSYWIGAFCALIPLVAMLVAGAKMFGINLGAPYSPSRGEKNDPKP